MMRRRIAGAFEEQILEVAFARHCFGGSLGGDTIADRVAHNQNACPSRSGVDCRERNLHWLVGPRLLLHYHPLGNRIDFVWLDSDCIGPIADGDKRVRNIDRLVEIRSFEWALAVHRREQLSASARTERRRHEHRMTTRPQMIDEHLAQQSNHCKRRKHEPRR